MPATAADMHWETLRVRNMLLCRAMDQGGAEVLALTISPESPFKPRRAQRAEEATVQGQKVWWYSGEIPGRPSELVREMLVELSEDRVAHVFIRAQDSAALARAQGIVQSLDFGTGVAPPDSADGNNQASINVEPPSPGQSEADTGNDQAPAEDDSAVQAVAEDQSGGEETAQEPTEGAAEPQEEAWIDEPAPSDEVSEPVADDQGGAESEQEPTEDAAEPDEEAWTDESAPTDESGADDGSGEESSGDDEFDE
jgi:hypothetical protein